MARRLDGVTLDEARTTATLVLLVVGLWVLNILARPITPFRGALFASMVGIFLLILALPGAREFYALEIPPEAALIAGLCIAGGAWRCSRSCGRSPAPSRPTGAHAAARVAVAREHDAGPR